jgi:di/tricarboxylate transporter
VSDVAISFAVLAALVVLFVWNRLPVEIVAVGAALVLWATGVLRLDQALAGFGDSSVIFIATLFVISEGLDATGVTAWVGQQLVAGSGASRTRLLVLTMLIVALLTALINPNGSVAALLPVVVVVAIRVGRTPSQLLMPVAFAAHAGSLLALTGTPVSVVVSEAAADAGARPFGFFEFALVGIPLLAGTIAIVVLFGERLLPHRTASQIPPDFSEHFKVLASDYRLQELTHRLRVGEASPFVGRTQAELASEVAAGGPELALVGVQVRGEGNLAREAVVAAGDVLLVRGAQAAVQRLAADDALELPTGQPGEEAGGLFTRLTGVAEVVIRPRSGLIGTTVFPGMVTESGELIIQAVQRSGEVLDPGETTLAAGDTLLVRGTWAALSQHLEDPDVLVVDAPERVRRQVVPMGPGSRQAVAVLVAMVVLLATGAVPAVVAGLLAAGALILLRVLTLKQAYAAISWTTVILVAGMIPLSTAMQETGAAALVADGLVKAVGGAGPYALVLGLVLLTAVFGQLISNMATALIVIPIAISVASETGISVLPVLMAVNVAAAASFLTPVATPANLMVMGPGAYRFGDYWKMGIVLLLLFVVVATVLVPLIWPF